MIELEKTYLAKEIPDDLKTLECREIIDIYIPESIEHPTLRIRQNGNKYELTKKEPVEDGDASRQNEQTIILTEAEFNTLNLQVVGKRVRKIRYFYNYNGLVAEFDVFQDSLEGLILIDFEFASIDEKDKFVMPGFCLADVTQETFIAGGMLCGKSYEDIENQLDAYGYRKLYLV